MAKKKVKKKVVKRTKAKKTVKRKTAKKKVVKRKTVKKKKAVKDKKEKCAGKVICSYCGSRIMYKDDVVTYYDALEKKKNVYHFKCQFHAM